MYLLFQFQMSKKEREICKFEMDLKKLLFCLHSNLSSDNIISASRPGLKMGIDCRGRSENGTHHTV